MGNTRRTNLGGLIAAAAVVAALFVFGVSPALAQTNDEAVCRATIAEHVSKFLATAFKDHASCHKKRSAGKLPLVTDCNQVLSIPKNKSGSVYSSASVAILAACPPGLTNVLAEFSRCPSPHSTLDDDGATSGIDDFQEATDCILNLALTVSDGASAKLLGHPTTLPTKAAAKCQADIGKVVTKQVKTIAKTRSKCQGTADQEGNGVNYSCATFDDGKIAKSLSKLQGQMIKSCLVPPDETAVLESCGQTPAQLAECVGRISSSVGGGLIATAFELPATCNIGHVAIAIHAGNGVRRTATNFDVGYNGLGHEVDLLDGFEGAVDLSCNDDCLNCAVTIAPVKDQGKSFCRCDADPTIHCDTIGGPDADDCGGGGCTCMFGPPLALSAAATPTCVVNKLVADIEGVADAGTGVSTTTVYNTAVVHTGITQTQPCPTCNGDLVTNDGVRAGTCSGGTRPGGACDRNGNSPDFGPVSYDCQPSPGANISGTGLKVKFDLTSVDAPLRSTELLDGPRPVFCLQCSGDTAIGCSSDDDCLAAGAGTCTVNTGPQARANGCSDGICTAAAPEDAGNCEMSPPDLFCDGMPRRSGRGLLACASQGDCDALGSSCPGGNCGTCSLLQVRSCLPNPFGAKGTHGYFGSTEASGVHGADLAATLCVAPTANVGVNTSVGLPGPGRLKITFEFDGRCASNHAVRFEIPGGSNCP